MVSANRISLFTVARKQLRHANGKREALRCNGWQKRLPINNQFTNTIGRPKDIVREKCHESDSQKLCFTCKSCAQGKSMLIKALKCTLGDIWLCHESDKWRYTVNNRAFFAFWFTTASLIDLSVLPRLCKIYHVTKRYNLSVAKWQFFSRIYLVFECFSLI